MQLIDNGLSSLQISKQLRNVVSQRTVRRWRQLYESTGKIDLRSPPGRTRTIRTKKLIRKVSKRLVSKGRQSARRLAKSFAVSRETMRRIIKNDLRLRPYRMTTRPKLTEDHKRRRVSFAYWVRRELKKEDHRQILFSDEKYFSVEGVFNRQNDRIYASSRLEADQRGGVHPTSKYPKRVMVWLGACHNGLTSPLFFKPGETLTHKNYIDVVLPHALSEGERLLGDRFIYQQDNAKPHVHRQTIEWCEQNFDRFISSRRWPANSPDLNVLDYHVWDAVNAAIRWEEVHDYDSLIDEIRGAVHRVPLDGLLRSIESWSHRLSTISSTKGIFFK